jgi:pantetheine-phosphate adenylyltransferase
MKGIYAGSFDPPTKGHEWMIKQGAEMFNELIIAIGVNPGKKYSFSAEERLEMLSEIAQNYPNVKITVLNNNYLVKYAHERGINYLLRGIRNEDDYKYEKQMRNINDIIEPSCKTIFLMPPQNLGDISSSLVKSLIGPDDWEAVVKQYVPETVYIRLLEKFENGCK